MNNLKELEKKYEELGKEIERLKGEKVGYSDDPIFLLSIEEYEKYKDKIPRVNCFWWLRSKGGSPINAASVNHCGSIDETGYIVTYDYRGVRPALKVDPNKYYHTDKSHIIRCGITWIKIDDGLYIAENPITFRRFDDQDNEYAISDIRGFLLDWYEERKSWYY